MELDHWNNLIEWLNCRLGNIDSCTLTFFPITSQLTHFKTCKDNLDTCEYTVRVNGVVRGSSNVTRKLYLSYSNAYQSSPREMNCHASSVSVLVTNVSRLLRDW